MQMPNSVLRRRLLISLLAVLLFGLATIGIAYWRYHEMRATVLADGTTLHRVLSQRVDQHDAHMTGLSALVQSADPPPLDAIQQVVTSIVRFYPRILGIEIVDLADENRPPLLGSGMVLSGIFDEVRKSSAILTVVPVEGSERVMLVKRVPPGATSKYLIVFMIDLRRLIETDAASPHAGVLQLLLDGRPLLTAASEFGSAPIVFESALASRTQPMVLRVAIPLLLSELFPLLNLMLVGLGLAFGTFILDRLLAARVAAREAGARAVLATQDARLAHASRVNAMGELASGIAHELTQPLTAILSQSQAGQRLAARPELDREAIQASFEASARNAKRAGDILGKLRSWVTKSQPVVEAVDLAAVISDVVLLTAAKAQAHAVTVEFERAIHPVLVRADRIQLEQVVFNLVCNAIDAAGSTIYSGRIGISLTAEEAFASVRVRDNGPGFTAKAQAQLFEPFFTTKRNGMGLGLALCMTLVERYSGTISASNAEKGGAELLVRLPLLKSEVGVALSEVAE